MVRCPARSKAVGVWQGVLELVRRLALAGGRRSADQSVCLDLALCSLEQLERLARQRRLELMERAAPLAIFGKECTGSADLHGRLHTAGGSMLCY